MNKLAVYGTLRKSGGRWGKMFSKFNGKALLPKGFTIFNMPHGGFPYVSELNGNSQVTVEVYEADDKGLRRCDQIESHPNFYCRKEIEIEGHGKCWVYLINDPSNYNGNEILSGDWDAQN